MEKLQNDVSDLDLLSAIQSDNQHAFRQLYERYWKPLYIRAAKNIGEDEAKDLVQEIMVSLWNRRHQLIMLQENELSKYLFTALKYRTISFYAYSKAQLKKIDLLQIDFAVSPDALLENKELETILGAAIVSMPQKMQQIFRMSRDEDMPIAKIASQLNLSEQTVKNQITQALRRVRATVIDHQNGDWILPVVFILYTSYR